MNNDTGTSTAYSSTVLVPQCYDAMILGARSLHSQGVRFQGEALIFGRQIRRVSLFILMFIMKRIMRIYGGWVKQNRNWSGIYVLVLRMCCGVRMSSPKSPIQAERWARWISWNFYENIRGGAKTHEKDESPPSVGMPIKSAPRQPANEFCSTHPLLFPLTTKWQSPFLQYIERDNCINALHKERVDSVDLDCTV